ncbi:hypothetical protein GQ44DRAFT_702599 [Phaeosphaeriaceae sp. PMI808]|nr:hypothetical protein GQ44DRAFT_702599 [Phaeosphaeriaceae sp. PMI808]
MGFTVDGNPGTICSYAKSKYEERLEERKRQRSSSEPRPGYGKLHKPPQVQTLHERPRNRLRKHNSLPPPTLQPVISLYVLEYEPYPRNMQPSQVLGIFSTFNAVTLGAFKHGAYAFSKEGMLDGSEYLSPTGRIKIVQTVMQQSGVKAKVPERSRSLDGEPVRLDIPHPESQDRQPAQPKEENSVRETLFLATREGPTVASWIGVFKNKNLAWGACLKDKATCALSDTICDEKKTIGINNLPSITGRLARGGRHTWSVVQYRINNTI